LDWKSLIEKCETQLRAGNVNATGQLISNLKLAEVPSDLRPTLANILRRSGKDRMSLRLLAPVVRGRRGQSTKYEKTEYAAALQKIGALEEAKELLSHLTTYTPAKLILSFCHFRSWDYNKAIPLLESYLLETSDLYQKNVGKLNLAAAYAVCGRLNEASQIIEDLIGNLRNFHHHRLLANAYEIRAQIQISSGDERQAMQSLKLAGTTSAGGYEKLFIAKWSAYLLARSTGDPSQLKDISADALNLRDWETVREVDLLVNRIQFDDERYSKLWIGTPYSAYRERIQTNLPNRKLNEFVRLGSGSHVFDPIAHTSEAPATVRIVLMSLLKDLYRPAMLGSLFANVFPGEHFDVFSSPNRIHQLLWRVRGWLKQNKVGVQVVDDGAGWYRLIPTQSHCILVNGEAALIPVKKTRIDRLSQKFQDRYFSMAEARQCLGMSTSHCKRLLQDAISENRCMQFGAHKATRYKLSG
jgi:tetratricopeptide (TPR) repeat protein